MHPPPIPNFQIGGFTVSQFLEGVAGNEEGDLFQGAAVFLAKDKILVYFMQQMFYAENVLISLKFFKVVEYGHAELHVFCGFCSSEFAGEK